jgi:RHS repeat-associated protein
MLSAAQADPTPWLPLPDIDDWHDGDAPADTERANNYYRARYYDPKIGRFISEDPIGFDGGINFYPYVENNPINYTDPSGNFPIIAIAPFIPALTDAAIATGAVLLAIVGGTAIAETWPPATVTTDPPGGGGATTMAPPRPKPIPAPPPPPPQQCGDDPGKRLKCLYRCEKQISHVLPPAVRAARLELCIKRCMAIDW